MPQLQQFLQQLINGLSIGAIYALIAVGYTMVYGVLRLINFAHGDVYMIGAMTGVFAASYVGQSTSGSVAIALRILICIAGAGLLTDFDLLGRSLWTKALGSAATVVVLWFMLRLVRWPFSPVTHPSWGAFARILITAMVVCGILGYVIELLAYRPLRDEPRIVSLITAIGVSMLLEFGGQATWMFGPNPKPFPDLIPGVEANPDLVHMGQLVIGKVDVLIFAVTLTMMFALRYVIQKTKMGLALRAVSYRFDTASLMGVNVNRVISFTFVLGSVLAAAAGVLVGLRSPKVDPLMGLLPGLKAFIAAVLGGIGDIGGAVAGGLLLGITEAMVVSYFPRGSQYRDGVAFLVLIAILVIKPSGLFGRAATEKV